MKQLIIGLFFALLFTACNKYTYPRDKEVSDKGGAIIDTLGGHLPKEIVYDGNTHTFLWDKDLSSQVNKYYLDTKEPVLFNYYQDRNIYRLMIQEKGKDPLILSVNKEKNNTWLVSKQIHSTEQTESDSTVQQPLMWVNFDIKSKNLNEQQIQTFDSLFQTIHFFEMPNDGMENKYDSFLILEAHEKDKYWYIYRPSDDASLKEISDFMKNLAGF